MAGGKGTVRGLDTRATQSNAAVVDNLNHAASMAEQFGALACAVCFVKPDGSVVSGHVVGDQSFALLGGVSLLEHEIRRGLEDEL